MSIGKGKGTALEFFLILFLVHPISPLLCRKHFRRTKNSPVTVAQVSNPLKHFGNQTAIVIYLRPSALRPCL